MEGTLDELIQEALRQLGDLELTDGTLKTYRTRAFAPVKKLYYAKHGMVMQKDFLHGLKMDFQKQYEAGKISRRTLNWNKNSYCVETFWMLLSAPRTRDHRAHPCMKQNETNQMLCQIDRTTPKGKRDFEILSLAASTGFRAGDIANLTLTNIDWNKKELHIVQGKADTMLTLLVSKELLTMFGSDRDFYRPRKETWFIMDILKNS